MADQNSEQLEKIKNLRAKGLTPKEISKATGVRRAEVDKVLRRLAISLVPQVVSNVPDIGGACSLCGKTKNLTTTPCCGQPICDDHHKYELFSYAHTSCARNHDRRSLCAFHYNNDHPGKWQDCKRCVKELGEESYALLAASDYNIGKPESVPDISIRCFGCKKDIKDMSLISMVTSKGKLCIKCAPDMDAAMKFM